MGRYNDQGQYILDSTDFEDSEALANADRAQAAINQRQVEQATRNQQAFMQKSWEGSLEKGEISQENYNKLLAADPELANELIKAGMNTLVEGMKSGRKGEAQPGVKPQAGQPAQVQAPSNASEAVASAKARANRGESISDSETNDILEMVVGRL